MLSRVNEIDFAFVHTDFRRMDKDENNRKAEATDATDVAEKKAIGPQNLSTFHLWAMGMCMALGGNYQGWCQGLVAGFGGFMLATAFVGSGYVCFLLSVAEVSSALPFAGGSYGIARVTLGVFPGYVIACLDSIESIMFTATAVMAFAQKITLMFDTSRNMEVLYWILAFGSVLGFHCLGSYVMWQGTLLLAVISFVILIVFICGKYPFVLGCAGLS